MYLVASILMNGAPGEFRQPPGDFGFADAGGPIIMMFFGETSSRISSGTRCRRQRLRTAIATARLASPWPMMWRSSSCTISRGVSCRVAVDQSEGGPVTT